MNIFFQPNFQFSRRWKSWGFRGRAAAQILILAALLNPLHAQSDLIGKKAELVEEIRRLRDEMAQENKQFESFRSQKESIISYKSKETQSLTEDIRGKNGEIRRLRREVVEVEAETLNLKKQQELVNQQVRRFAVEIQAEIDRGVPFEREKRKSILSSLIFDIDNSAITANESFSRLLSFLNLEESMSYDSQVVRSSMEVAGVVKDVNLIRIGRIFFAVNDGQRVYLWRSGDGGYRLDPKGVDPFLAQSIREVEEIIQGKRIPDLVLLPIPQNRIEVVGETEGGTQ